MSDQDTPAPEVVERPDGVDLSDLPEFPEEPAEPEVEDEEQEEREDADDAATEEGGEGVDVEAEEPEQAAGEEPGEPSAGPDLSRIPEEYRDHVEAYAKHHIAELQRSYDDKLKEAAETRKAREIVDAFDRRLQEDPDGLIADLQEIAAQSKPPDDDPEPAKPGDMPDEYADPTEFVKWARTDAEHREWRMRQEIKRARQEVLAEVQPALETTRKLQAQQQLASIRQALDVDEPTFSEISAEAQKIRGDTNAGWQSIKELVTLRKEVERLKKGQTTKVREQIEGSEERSGLPSTGKRKAPPRSTGDVRKDVDRSLKHDGIEFPEGH